MTVPAVLDSAGRRRSPATLPGFHAGRAPRNKGMLYPADPPTVEEIVCVLRHASEDPHDFRLRAMIVMLWRGGLRVQEALALSEHDLDQQRGSVLVRRDKGGRRREVGMDGWGWENLRPWLTARLELPAGPLFCVIDGPTRGRPWSAAAVRTEFRRHASEAGVTETFRSPSATSRTRGRARARGRVAERHPAPARPFKPRHHEHLPAGDRDRGDHLDGARTSRAHDVGDSRPSALNEPDAQSASADLGALAPGARTAALLHASSRLTARVLDFPKSSQVVPGGRLLGSRADARSTSQSGGHGRGRYSLRARRVHDPRPGGAYAEVVRARGTP